MPEARIDREMGEQMLDVLDSLQGALAHLRAAIADELPPEPKPRLVVIHPEVDDAS